MPNFFCVTHIHRLIHQQYQIDQIEDFGSIWVLFRKDTPLDGR